MIVRSRDRCRGDAIGAENGDENDAGDKKDADDGSAGSGGGSADDGHDEAMRSVAAPKTDHGAVRLISAFFVRSVRTEMRK